MNAFARQTVLVPIDYSDDARLALDVGREIVDSSGTLHVVHVFPPPPVGTVVPATSSEERSAHGLSHLQQFLHQAGVVDVTPHVREGDPGHEIVNLAEKLKADIVVMPSHGRTGLAHVLIGLVAERVVRLAPCPVLVLRSHPSTKTQEP